MNSIWGDVSFKVVVCFKHFSWVDDPSSINELSTGVDQTTTQDSGSFGQKLSFFDGRYCQFIDYGVFIYHHVQLSLGYCQLREIKRPQCFPFQLGPHFLIWLLYIVSTKKASSNYFLGLKTPTVCQGSNILAPCLRRFVLNHSIAGGCKKLLSCFCLANGFG